MQTFLPYSDVELSAKCLDWRRLNKQRVESLQILNCLTGLKSGWSNHPAVKMWRGHEDFLKLYMNACIAEWIRRGFKNTMKQMDVSTPIEPKWWGSKIHTTHRAALLSKNIEWYSQFGWEEYPVIDYFWPEAT